MNKYLPLVLGALLSSGAAQAVTVLSIGQMVDNVSAFGVAHVVADFDSANATGYTFAPGSDLGIAATSNGNAAEPYGNVSVYGYVSSALGTGIATLKTQNLKSLGFQWGSIDSFNSVDILGAGGITLKTVFGSDISSASGNQTILDTNRRVFFVADAGEVITGVRFKSTGVAFEFDNITANAVPEPASWALMITGFGMVGFAARRRRATTVATA